jgi:type 1 glutamine amidotransferase
VTRLVVAALLFALMVAMAPAASKPRLLVVTVANGYRHDSIPVAERVVESIGAEGGAFTVEFARTDEELAVKAAPKALAAYDGVVFASTSGEPALPEREGFLDWIAAGHAFVGIHSATATFHGFPAYLDMIGGEFARHGEQATAQVQVREADHPATIGLGQTIAVFDELYEFKRIDPNRLDVLLGLDRHPETGAPGDFPLAWTREHGKGRVFYTALGHREDVLQAAWFKRHLRGGITWALGRDTAAREEAQ